MSIASAVRKPNEPLPCPMSKITRIVSERRKTFDEPIEGVPLHEGEHVRGFLPGRRFFGAAVDNHLLPRRTASRLAASTRRRCYDRTEPHPVLP